MDAALLQRLAAGGASPQEELSKVVKAAGATAMNAESVSEALDKALGALSSFQRSEFMVPKNRTLPQTDAKVANLDDECVYLVGNSLGLQPKKVKEYVNEELDSWAALGVNGHFSGKREWMPIDELVIQGSAAVAGALPSEVAIMNSLTVNLHLLMVSFYRPQGKRNRILYEANCFGSDFFAFESQARLHGVPPSEALLPLAPREGEELLRTEDIVKAIEEAGDTLAVVCLGTVQYYSGQFFEVPKITAAAQRVGAAALWDCAHAVGNLDLKLHDWGVDGACWCTYKYLNAGPGGIGGFFVHEKHHGKGLPMLAGWWGQKKATRFNMAHAIKPEDGASAWRLSNPPVLQTVSLLASLEVFGKTSMSELRGRSMLLTGFLEALLKERGLVGADSSDVQVITPSDPAARGCQLSLKFQTDEAMHAVFTGLGRRGIVVDDRKPNVIRVAPAPLYSTFRDVRLFVDALAEAVEELDKAPPAKRVKV
mmetsp:Transcript_32544/g.95238  ORF Transcript_32544/g.95238 Transcript_32544/m.95238 type:complete len:482 (+) Transcript_32544:105-1550(+)